MPTIYYKECIICKDKVESKCLCEEHYNERLNFIHWLKNWKSSFWYRTEDYAPYLYFLYEGIKETLIKNKNIPKDFRDTMCILLYSIGEILEKYPDGSSNQFISDTPYPNLEEETKNFIYSFNSSQVQKNTSTIILESTKNLSEEFIDYRTKFPLTYRCSDGHFVRSKAEREIDNFLFSHDITHVYEYHYLSPNEKEYFPDFYIPKYHLIIEYFGLNKEKYLNTKSEKIETYSKDKRYNFEYLTPDHDNDLEFYLTKIFKKYQKNNK